MRTNLIRKGLLAALGVTAVCAMPMASAQYVTVGGNITLGNGPGAGPGGEFIATVLSGGSGSFNTFCLEYNEYFSYGQTLRVQNISLGAVNGGVGVGAGGTAPANGQPGFDPISKQTAWLYTQFRAGSLSGYGGSNHASDANALQNAIWYLENEITSLGSGITTAERDRAQSWINSANTAVAAGWSNNNVRVLNLMRQDAQGNFTVRAQDQLYITPVPEPETYMMLLAGLGLMGFVARRRRTGLVG